MFLFTVAPLANNKTRASIWFEVIFSFLKYLNKHDEKHLHLGLFYLQDF